MKGPFYGRRIRGRFDLDESPTLWVGTQIDPSEQLPAYPALLSRGLHPGELDEVLLGMLRRCAL